MLLEQRRAREPDEEGEVVRDGVGLHYEVYGDGPVTVLLMPTWSIVHSRIWKAQIPYLARHHRVVTFDGRGNGRSDAPEGAAAYRDDEYVADAAAVLDATATPAAVVVGFSCGATWSIGLAADHPERVLGVVAIAGVCGFPLARPEREQSVWDGQLDTTRGWAKYNRRYWLDGGFDDFRSFFFHQLCSEPHSTKQYDDLMAWSADVPAQVVADTTAARLGCDGVACGSIEQACARVRCPVHVIHGTEDRIRPAALGERLAELTGGDLTLIEGGGHGPMNRHPVLVNHVIRDVIAEVAPDPPRRRTWVRSLGRTPRVLFLSSPIGLGHARRDLAIADELRRVRPELRIDWLAQEPVTRVLRDRGEQVHPASAWLASESDHIDDEAHEHDLHAFGAIRRMDEILVANFMVFDEVVREQHYDLVVGDEAWEVDHFLHENPELKRFGYAWMTDFVGWLPMPDGGAREAELTADHNAEMLEQRARHHRLRDRSVFVGSPEDIVPDRFGPDLPLIREWTEQNFDFAGYVTGFAPPGPEERAACRRRLGYRPDDLLCVVTVGGSGTGAALLGRVLDAVPIARRAEPRLRFLVVTGPRLDPRALPRRAGVRVRGYLPDLYQHLAAADLAVVQGGLTTCMELTAAGTPFLFVPLQHHFEQAFHVPHRLRRYDAGRQLSYAEATDPDFLAAAILAESAGTARFRPVETDGAARAAALLADLC
ncbi:alpha/beta hydrolase [Nocardioides insulae]|uniref:alpha/beta hydrolase n=1 Tax=Nocardioides insulae TaxID=394734 RepID=UPI0003F95781|nr:alpha/beta hydrolase [Nocardioides insulae]